MDGVGAIRRLPPLGKWTPEHEIMHIDIRANGASNGACGRHKTIVRAMGAAEGLLDEQGRDDGCVHVGACALALLGKNNGLDGGWRGHEPAANKDLGVGVVEASGEGEENGAGRVREGHEGRE